MCFVSNMLSDRWKTLWGLVILLKGLFLYDTNFHRFTLNLHSLNIKLLRRCCSFWEISKTISKNDFRLSEGKIIFAGKNGFMRLS